MPIPILIPLFVGSKTQKNLAKAKELDGLVIPPTG